MKIIQKIVRPLLFLVVEIILLSNYNTVSGQVSIGSTQEPEKAALLQLKTQQADINNVTSDKGGLLLSRVKLVNRKTLEPFIVNDSDFQNNGNKVKDLHTGLIVYNIYVSASQTDPDLTFDEGVYVWDGTQWQQAGESVDPVKWFYPPAFNLPLPKIDTNADPVRTFDLYGEYKRQFTKNLTDNPTFVDTQNGITNSVPSPADGQLYLPEELDYIITYYDPEIIRDVTINTNGVLSYRVKDNDPGSHSFLNLVFVVKE